MSVVTAHRRDIDGLRAVAVLAVVAYHLVRGVLPGGYLGVDIFFVISGYLITGIIWRELNGPGFSIRQFYLRRVRRIAPALLVLLLLTTVAATAILLPVDLMGFARSVLTTLGFVSNIYFWRDSDYFSRAAAEKPLLHTWSLGIEEQFYILFPLLLIAVARMRRNWTPWVILILTLGSLAANVLALKIGADLPAFYLLPTRAWELGAGALLVFIRPPKASVQVNVMAFAGVALVLVALVLDPAWLPALVPAALAAVVGSALLIWSGGAVGKPVLTAQALGLRLPAFIGLISYSLYLWHWPIIVLAQYWLVRSLTGSEALVLVVPIFLLALLSWQFVERPFRERSFSTPRSLAVTGGGAVLAISGAGMLLLSAGLPSRLSVPAARINAAAGTNYRCPINDYIAFGASRGCKLGLPNGDPEQADAVLLGNSHAQMYAPLVAEIFAEHGLKGLLVPANGCLPIAEFNISVECIGIARTNIEAVAQLTRARLVLLGLTWNEEQGPFVDSEGRRFPVQGTEAVERGIEATAARLRRSGKTVGVIGPIATPNWDVASTLSRSIAFGRPVSLPLHQTSADFAMHFGTAIDRLANSPELFLIRPDRVQCGAVRCEFLIGGQSLFADETHLATTALPRFRGVFAAAIVAGINSAWAGAVLPPTSPPPGRHQGGNRGREMLGAGVGTAPDAL